LRVQTQNTTYLVLVQDQSGVCGQIQCRKAKNGTLRFRFFDARSHSVLFPGAASVRCLSLFDDANEAGEAGGVHVAYGDDFEIVGVKTGDVKSGVFCVQRILFRLS
jgi:hypothetical protein